MLPTPSPVEPQFVGYPLGVRAEGSMPHDTMCPRSGLGPISGRWWPGTVGIRGLSPCSPAAPRSPTFHVVDGRQLRHWQGETVLVVGVWAAANARWRSPPDRRQRRGPSSSATGSWPTKQWLPADREPAPAAPVFDKRGQAVNPRFTAFTAIACIARAALAQAAGRRAEQRVPLSRKTVAGPAPALVALSASARWVGQRARAARHRPRHCGWSRPFCSHGANGGVGRLSASHPL